MSALKNHDLELFNLIEQEKYRQFSGLELIASENFTSAPVLECLGSCLTNKYAEGEVGARYYGGVEFVDQIERLAQVRALHAFDLNPDEWGVSVQPYSGSPANFAVYTALLNPHDRIMGLDLPSGGHLTHGYYTAKKKVSATSIYFESLPYSVLENGEIDFEGLQTVAELYRPKLIICGASAFTRDLNYSRFSEIANAVGAYLMCDMAHVAGLIAAKQLSSPFQYCDVVTTTTHKSLRGPRAGMIFYRKMNSNGEKTGFEIKIQQAVFPGLQGGPHMNAIAAIATQMKEVSTDSFKEYAKQVVLNARALAQALKNYHYTLVSDGTDNHIILWDLRPQKLTGSKLEKILEACKITVNKNAVFGDKNALSPSGIRIGTLAITSRGFKETDMMKVGDFLHRVVELALSIQEKSGSKLSSFLTEMSKTSSEIELIRTDVENLATKFPLPGVDIEISLKKP